MGGGSYAWRSLHFLLGMSALGSEGEWQPSRNTRAVITGVGETLVKSRGDPPAPPPRGGVGVGVGGGGGSVSGNRCAAHSQQLYLSHTGLAGAAGLTADGRRWLACAGARARALACLLRGAEAATAPVFAPSIFTPPSLPEAAPAASLAAARTWLRGNL